MSNTSTSAATSVAAIVVEAAIGGARGTVAGALVQPVVWAATGTSPDAGDVVAYGAGVGGGLISLAWSLPGAAVGLVKAMVDDHTAGLVAEARAEEPAYARGSIKGVDDYSFWGGNRCIDAMTIASAGGVAWQHRNGVWCFIADANDRLVCDYRPASAVETYAPLLPLQRGETSGFRWTVIR